MLCNVIDNRSRRYRWRRVEAILEATSHDNGCADSDAVEPADDELLFDRRDGLSVAEAVAWADAQPGMVTLFLYDEGTNSAE
jgi:hypothetical protein